MYIVNNTDYSNFFSRCWAGLSKEELKEVALEKCTMFDLNKLILQSKNYEKEICKLLLETNSADRKE